MRTASGLSPGRVLGLLGSSLGLCTEREDVTAATLLARFDPDRLPRRPWMFRP